MFCRARTNLSSEPGRLPPFKVIGDPCNCFGVEYFKYMFRVWGPPMAQMFASGIVGSSEVKLRQQNGVPRSSASAVSEYNYCHGLDYATIIGVKSVSYLNSPEFANAEIEFIFLNS